MEASAYHGEWNLKARRAICVVHCSRLDRIMPYGITVGALTILFILIIFGLIAQRRLLPGVVILGAFILFVLYVAGLVETAIQLFGPAGNIQGNCQQYVFSQPQRDLSRDTLAWLEQNGICQAWQAVFAFWIIGAVFLVYMIIVASNVARGSYDT